mgnify:CR=1 FL=1
MISGPVDPAEAAKKILQKVFKTKNKAKKPVVVKKEPVDEGTFDDSMSG